MYLGDLCLHISKKSCTFALEFKSALNEKNRNTPFSADGSDLS